MGRPKLTNPTVYTSVGLPLDLYGRVQLELVSELTGKVPQGKIQEFFTMLVRQHFDHIDKEAPRSAFPHSSAPFNPDLSDDDDTPF